jgi:hypothetical protein
MVVVTTPGFHDCSGFMRRSAPVLPQAFVAQLAVEQFDVDILGQFSRFD